LSRINLVVGEALRCQLLCSLHTFPSVPQSDSFILGVLDGVMAEVEPLGHMNGIPYPLREVCVPDHAFLARVLVHDYLLEVVVIDQALLLRKVT
jgi:hypothetical protein